MNGMKNASGNARCIATEGPEAGGKFPGSVLFLERKATDRTAILGTGDLDEERVRRCLQPIGRQHLDLHIPVRFTVAADGRATEHHATWPAPIPPDIRDCLDRALAEVRFNCPLSGASEVHGVLSIGR
jgi:hypothetical protein